MTTSWKKSSPLYQILKQPRNEWRKRTLSKAVLCSFEFDTSSTSHASHVRALELVVTMPGHDWLCGKASSIILKAQHKSQRLTRPHTLARECVQKRMRKRPDREPLSENGRRNLRRRRYVGSRNASASFRHCSSKHLQYSIARVLSC